MPFNEFEAWTTNQVLTAASLNEGVRDNLYYLEDAVQNVDVSNASALTTGTVDPARLPSGAVVATKMTVKTDASSLGSVARGAVSGGVPDLTVSITPQYSDSKILVRGDINVSCSAGSDTFVYLYRKLGSGEALPLEGATGDLDGIRRRVTASVITAGGDISAVSFAYLDSPNTTEPVVYSVRLGHDRDGAATPFVNRSSGDSNSNRVARTISTIQASEVRP